MADITAAMVKELRERTQAGMSDCKNALVEAGGDMAKAVEVLQKKGAAKAVKAAGRIAADGGIFAGLSADGKTGAILEVNCQTDFVARGDEFKGFGKLGLEAALDASVKDLASLESFSKDGKTVKETGDALTAKSGEKHAVRRVEKFTLSGTGVLYTYIHAGARIGVLVEIASAGAADAVTGLAEAAALQVASMNARYVTRADVPKEVISKQEEIFAAQMQGEVDEAARTLESARAEVAQLSEVSDAVKEHVSKLEKDLAAKQKFLGNKDKIVPGKVSKWLTEIVLMDQESIMEAHEKKTWAKVIADFSGKNGATTVTRFARFEVGEGVERAPAKDFAQEVAEMAAAAAAKG